MGIIQSLLLFVDKKKEYFKSYVHFCTSGKRSGLIRNILKRIFQYSKRKTLFLFKIENYV